MRQQRKPAYQLHKATGQARVHLAGRDFYLGEHNSPQSRVRYDELITEWLVKQDTSRYSLTIDDLCLLFLRHANSYYRRRDGTPTGTIDNFKEALRYLVKMYGTNRVREFGPKKLKSIRDAMIDDNRCRTNINRLVALIRQVFRWGVEEEIVPAGVHQSIAAVRGLRAGRSNARESEPVPQVSDAMVAQTIPHLPATVADMVTIQRLTGCRPTEVCKLRPCDLDRSGRVWRYTPDSHKSEHHGRHRVIMIGPKAQAVLLPHLLRDKTSYCFSPMDSEKKRQNERHLNRKTHRSHGNKPGTNRKRNPKRKPSERYNKDSYARAIARACEKAFPPPEPLARHSGESVRSWLGRLNDQQQEELKAWKAASSWSPNQLRHTLSTEVRRDFGLEAAQVVLGHSRADVTQIYAERDLQLAEQVMVQIG